MSKDQWEEFFNRDVGLCGLCGNRGVIDTRESAISVAGVRSGGLHWCICPNGRVYKKHGKFPMDFLAKNKVDNHNANNR